MKRLSWGKSLWLMAYSKSSTFDLLPSATSYTPYALGALRRFFSMPTITDTCACFDKA